MPITDTGPQSERVSPDAARPGPAPTSSADQPPGPVQPDAPVWPPNPPVSPASTAGQKPAKTGWTSHFATWPTHLGNGLTLLGKGLAHLGRWLARLGRRIARLCEMKPTPLQRLAILGALAALSVFGALAFPGNALGKACVIAFVPGLCLAVGILGTRFYTGHELDQHFANAIQNAVYAALHLKRSVRYVDERLSVAQSHLESGNSDGALIEVVRAKTATELSLSAAEQASNQWESLSASGAPAAQSAFTAGDHQGRPRISEGSNPKAMRTGGEQAHRDDNSEFIGGSVARVVDEYTVIINRGSEHGAKLEMVFVVLADGGDQILDPETGNVIGELPTEKLRVKVVDVQPKYSRAVTFRTFTPAKVEYPALTGFARTSSGSEIAGASDVGTFDSFDESISKMLETELAESIPAREKIANAKSTTQQDAAVSPQVSIDIGDRVRQVR